MADNAWILASALEQKTSPSPLEGESGFVPERCIIAVAQYRDINAFNALFIYYAPRLKSYFIRRGLARANVEDLAQDAMLLVWNRANQFDPARGPASAWIFTIGRHLNSDHYRRTMKFLFDEEIPLRVDLSPAPDDRLAAVEEESRLRNALSKLDAHQHELLRLSFFENKTHMQIATDSKLPLGTVKSLIRRTLLKLRSIETAGS